jgi:alpha-mannosidase
MNFKHRIQVIGVFLYLFIMKLLLVLFLALPLWCQSQTVLEFDSVISGEEIHYFSPYKSFADQAWLSRCNGASPVEIKLKQTSLSGPSAQLKLLIGHSSGTNSGERFFDFYFNDRFLGTLTTTRPSKSSDVIKLTGNPDVRGTFVTMEEDINGDDFGYLTVDIPGSWLNDQNKIRMVGQDQQSRDWLMIFNYSSGFKAIPQVTNLVLKDNNKRQLNVLVDCPYPQEEITLISQGFQVKSKLRWGYNTIELPGYNADFVGKDTLVIQLKNHPLTFTYPVEVKPIKPFEFHLIHHSHNDIGYSHLQEEVIKIQTENIRAAMRWMNSAQAKNQRAIWHVESLWAVENFLHHASPSETVEFKNWVEKGNMVLSANYANVLTGLCRKEEMDWMVEYAKKLERDWGIQIQQAMITDIPGVGYEGLRGYVRNGIAHLSLGPNYIESQQDRGDRVGSIIQETGDTYFKWKSSEEPDKELLVWTAGKGYSYFHSIQDSEKTQKWESKVSQYVGELSASSYPLSFVQLRYTKNADNGPVDSTLCDWVDHWNNKYSMPKLIVSSLPELFEKLEKETPTGKTVHTVRLQKK